MGISDYIRNELKFDDGITKYRIHIKRIANVNKIKLWDYAKSLKTLSDSGFVTIQNLDQAFTIGSYIQAQKSKFKLIDINPEEYFVLKRESFFIPKTYIFAINELSPKKSELNIIVLVQNHPFAWLMRLFIRKIQKKYESIAENIILCASNS